MSVQEATTATGSAARDTRVGAGAVGWLWAILLSALFIAISVLLIYTLVQVWPPAVSAGTTTSAGGTAQVATTGAATHFLLWDVTLSPDQALLLLVAVAGALGAMAHVLQSFTRYVGERSLVWSWVPSYFIIPIIGSLLATITYVVIRAGLISTTAGAVGNTFGFAAVAALVGLFSAQATAKLKQVFVALFAEASQSTDQLASKTEGGKPAAAAGAAVLTISPTSARTGTPVVIIGADLTNVTKAVFTNNVEANAEWEAPNGPLRTTVPDTATSGPISVTKDGTTYVTREPFTVTTP